ncbi:MAG TPA: NAD-dependent epimerase [Waterburya sp.]|jgi:UDP-glucuronate 4-epimerase
MKVLVTGVAGFIGYHLSQRLLAQDIDVYGIDNLNDYYDVQLKQDRLAQLQPQARFTFERLDLANRDRILQLFPEQHFDYVINLAAQAGVRYSIQNPFAYVDSNMAGFVNLLEGCRHTQVKHLVFASSSSVYGANTKIPFAVTDNVDYPISLYAASKKANELMAHVYSHLYNLPTTGLRFFTVYGPWGRPDMAYFKFVQAIEEGRAIDVYNFGKMKRDFTYIDDVVEGVVRVMHQPPKIQPQASTSYPEEPTSKAPYKLYNVGNNSPVELGTFIEVIEKALGKTAQKKFFPMQPGDVPATYADVDELIKDVGFKPSTSIDEGINRFVQWYRDYYKNR